MIHSSLKNMQDGLKVAVRLALVINALDLLRVTRYLKVCVSE